MADTPTKPAAKHKAPRKPKGPDLAELERLLAIADGYRVPQYLALLHRLETEEGGKLTDAPHGGKRFTLAGLKADSTAGTHGALGNWLTAARRHVRGVA